MDNQINHISSTIASAVEEQSVTTNEMGRSVGEAARGVDSIAENISGVAEASRNTSRGAEESLAAAKNLAGMATQLQEVVGRFKL